MKVLRLKVWCQASYIGEIGVPDDMTEEEAIEYARDNIGDVLITSPLEYLPDSDEIDEEDASPTFYKYGMPIKEEKTNADDNYF